MKLNFSIQNFKTLRLTLFTVSNLSRENSIFPWAKCSLHFALSTSIYASTKWTLGSLLGESLAMQHQLLARKDAYLVESTTLMIHNVWFRHWQPSPVFLLQALKIWVSPVMIHCLCFEVRFSLSELIVKECSKNKTDFNCTSLGLTIISIEWQKTRNVVNVLRLDFLLKSS